MKYFKIFAITLALMIILSSAASATSYEIKDFGIKNIDMPEDYMSCSTELCDEDLQKLLSGNGFTFDDWKSQVMEPSNFYIYSCNKNKLTDCMYLMCEKINSPKSSQGNVSHLLAEDYNLIADGGDKTAFLDEMVKSNNIDNAKWLDIAGDTPYIEYFTTLGEDNCHCYETIYGGNRITLMFSSKKAFANLDIDNHSRILATLTYQEKHDYTEVQELIAAAVQKQLEEETHSGENTKILRIIISVSLVIVIAFAIIMAVRTQSKKRRKTIVLREPEATEKTDEPTED